MGLGAKCNMRIIEGERERGETEEKEEGGGERGGEGEREGGRVRER